MDFFSYLGAWASIFGLVFLLFTSQSSATDIPQDGVCLAEDSEALQVYKSVCSDMQVFHSFLHEYSKALDDLPRQVEGDWWVVKGQNCGQEGWPGGYDWYPCQGGPKVCAHTESSFKIYLL